MTPYEIRERALEQRREALAEALRREREGSPIPMGQMVGNHYVAPHWTQHLAAVINPLLQSANTRRNIEQLKKDEGDFYNQNKQVADEFFAELMGRPASQTDQAGFGPVPQDGTTIAPTGANKTRILSKGVELPGAAGELSRRMLIEQLVSEPAKQEQRDFQDKELRMRLDETAANREATAAYRQAEQARQDARDAADRGLRREIAGASNDTRRVAIEAAADKAEAKAGAAQAAKAADSQEVLNLLATAREIVPKATSSGLGAARDAVMGVFGQSTDAADAASKLKTIGGMLVSKVPRMQGPQSDKDVILYREMAGRIGDASVPVSQRLAAIDTLEELHRRYAGLPAPTTSPRAQSGTVGTQGWTATPRK